MEATKLEHISDWLAILACFLLHVFLGREGRGPVFLLMPLGEANDHWAFLTVTPVQERASQSALKNAN